MTKHDRNCLLLDDDQNDWADEEGVESNPGEDMDEFSFFQNENSRSSFEDDDSEDFPSDDMDWEDNEENEEDAV